MDEIGKNLKYDKYALQELTSSTLKIKNASQGTRSIDISTIKHVEIVGVNSASGFCGTMEFGMSNPTFILPTNFFYNIINLFKRNKDVIHIKTELNDGTEMIVLGTKNHYTKLQKLI